MAFQGEYFVERYGSQQAKRHSPPIRRMLEMGVPVGAGNRTQPAFRAITLTSPSIGLSPGKTVGGLSLYSAREPIGSGGSTQALHTMGSSLVFNRRRQKRSACSWPAWLTWLFSQPTISQFPRKKSSISNRYLQIVGGKIVYAGDEFSKFAPPALPVSPSWSPVKQYGGYAKDLNHNSWCISPPAACSHVRGIASLAGPQSHLQVLGEFGLWGLGLRLLCVLIHAWLEGSK